MFSIRKYKEILKNKDIPMNLKRQVSNQCILPTLTYGCQTWTLNKAIIKKMEICQRKIERKMLGMKLIDKIPKN